MRTAALAALVLLAGCDSPPAPEGEDAMDKAAARFALENPVGRFQMLPGGRVGEDIFLLDSRNGSLRRCWFAVKGGLKVNCGDPSPGLLQ